MEKTHSQPVGPVRTIAALIALVVLPFILSIPDYCRSRFNQRVEKIERDVIALGDHRRKLEDEWTIARDFVQRFNELKIESRRIRSEVDSVHRLSFLTRDKERLQDLETEITREIGFLEQFNEYVAARLEAEPIRW